MAALLAAATLLGCGDGESEATSAASSSTSTTSAPSRAPGDHTPAALASCEGSVEGWRPLGVGHGHGELDAAVLGKGRLGFVLANDSGNQTCGWLSFARELAEHGMRVAVFEYGSVGSPAEVHAVAAALRAEGADRVIAAGASVGGRAVIRLAAKPSPGVDAVVSLSAERQLSASYPDILPAARRVRLASLYLGSRHDGYTLFGKDTAQLHEATPAPINELLIVPGSDHGVDLLAGRNGSRVRSTILSFAARAVDHFLRK